MNSKTSFFKKSLFISDMRRYWWVGATETLLLLLSVTIPLYNSLEKGYKFIPNWAGNLFTLFIFCVSVVTLLLSYMHSSASVSTMHTLPMGRKSMFMTKLISATVLLIPPILIAGLFNLLVLANGGGLTAESTREVITWIYTGVMYTSVLFALTTAVNMMTGHPVGTIVFTCGFTALPFIVSGFFSLFFETELYGYTSNSDFPLYLSYIYIGEKETPLLAIYLIYSAILLTGAYLMYKKRNLENHGEVIAFKYLKPVFIGIIAMFASMFGYFYIKSITRATSPFYLIPFGILGTAIAWMISRKSLKLKGILKPVAVYLLITTIFCIIVHYDLTFYERYVPDTEDISEIVIWNNDDRIFYNYGQETHYIPEGRNDNTFTEKEDFEKITALHKYLITSKKKIFDNQIYVPADNYLPISYKLKNGKTITRKYEINYSDDAELMKPIFETVQAKAYFYPILDGTNRSYTQLAIHNRESGKSMDLFPNDTNMNKLYDALKSDLENSTYEQFIENNDAVLTISLYFDYTLIPRESKNPSAEARPEYGNDYYIIKPSYTNTLAVLEEIGWSE